VPGRFASHGFAGRVNRRIGLERARIVAQPVVEKPFNVGVSNEKKHLNKLIHRDEPVTVCIGNANQVLHFCVAERNRHGFRSRTDVRGADTAVIRGVQPPERVF
jgi:hydroxyethylthiazole kinase-like sugar kinase family protein